MFGNSDVDAMWCYQGGDVARQVLDLLDYETIKKNHKNSSSCSK